MGHYLSEMEDRPRDYISEYRELGYRRTGHYLYHEPCFQAFHDQGSYKPVPEQLVKHAEVCK